MSTPRLLNPFVGIATLVASGLTGLSVQAQTLTLNNGDAITVTGSGTVGTLNNSPISNSTSSYASPSHGISGSGSAVTLNGTAAFTLGSGGTAIATSQGDYAVFANGSGPVVLNGGTLSSGTTSAVGLSVGGSSPITMSSGTISVTGNSDIGIAAFGTGSISFSGGSITAGGGGTGLQTSGISPVAISGGTITSQRYGVITGTGPVTISGGMITGSGGGNTFDTGLTTGSGAVIISGGTIKSDATGLLASGPVTVTGGTITGGGNANGLVTGTGLVTILGGTITGQSSGLYASGTGPVLITSGNIMGTGTVADGVFAGKGSTVTISGGNISGGLNHIGQIGDGLQASGGTINLFSFNDTPFLIDGVPMNNTTLGQYTSGSDIISGTLANGSLLALTFSDAGGIINLNVGTPPAIPEASTIVSFGLLLAFGLGGMVIAAKKKQTAATA